VRGGMGVVGKPRMRMREWRRVRNLKEDGEFISNELLGEAFLFMYYNLMI